MKITRLGVHRVILDAWGVETRYTKTLGLDIPLETTVPGMEDLRFVMRGHKPPGR